ncbi:MAG: hypothetical protein Kow0092_30490 [Deferrisomatales bacterium]
MAVTNPALPTGNLRSQGVKDSMQVLIQFLGGWQPGDSTDVSGNIGFPDGSAMWNPFPTFGKEAESGRVERRGRARVPDRVPSPPDPTSRHTEGPPMVEIRAVHLEPGRV